MTETMNTQNQLTTTDRPAGSLALDTRSASSRWRKKPVVIEAFQITEDLAKRQFSHDERLPFGVVLSGSYHKERGEVNNAYAYIETLEGKMLARMGDWIIKGVKGELYPCKPDIFAASYDPDEPNNPVTDAEPSTPASTRAQGPRSV